MVPGRAIKEQTVKILFLTRSQARVEAAAEVIAAALQRTAGMAARAAAQATAARSARVRADRATTAVWAMLIFSVSFKRPAAAAERARSADQAAQRRPEPAAMARQTR